MRSTSYRTASYRAHPSAGSRATATMLSLAILVAIILALLWAGRRELREPPRGDPLATFDVTETGTKAASPSARPAPRAQPKAATQAAQPQVRPAEPTPDTPVQPVTPWIRLDRGSFARSDIGKMPGASAGSGSSEVADSGGGPTTPGIPGGAPNGETLYPAEWYREPTRAEMATYMPNRSTSGYGLIMCRTVARWHVEDCRQMGETPGSGISRAMRQASFQFLVRPPTVNGKPQIGVWVRIRFDLIVKGGGDAPPDAPPSRPRAGVGATGPVLN
ncbi:hypothetical protein [Sphingomonas sp. RS2018]